MTAARKRAPRVAAVGHRVNVWTKICGIVRPEDAVAAAHAGADAIGVNFCTRSARYCEASAAAEIVDAVRNAVAVYGVFADAAAEDVAATVAALALDGVQLHGGEDARFVERLQAVLADDVEVVRAVAVTSRTAAAEALAARNYRVLLDSPRGGGSGSPFDADLVAGLDLSRAIAAGGLTPENVGATVARLRPWGVDTASGVERSPGVKDHARIREFIEHAKHSAA